MTKARLDGLYMLLLGSVIFVLLGTVLASTSPAAMVDFRELYYSARCLVQHCDPYNANELMRVTEAEGGFRPWDNAHARQVLTQYIYLPTAFSFTVPFAMLPWGIAHILWMALLLGSLIFASFLIWNVGADSAPILSGLLIGFLLANSEVLALVGNMAGIAISLCVVAVWCFVRERFVLAGVACLAISLAVKPHDAGLVWLYFLLAGGVYRKRALQTLAATVAVGLPGILWVWHVSPHWIQEWTSNVAAFSGRGGMSDPGPTSVGSHGLGMQVNLQAVISVFRDDPHFYNPVTYLICAPLLLLWVLVTLRSRPLPARAWIGLAAIAALSLLPIYHRQTDTKLLLLTVPACAMLWAEGGLTGRLALLVTTAGFVFNGDVTWAILLGTINRLHLPTAGLSGQILMAVQVFPAPLALLATGVFYLWVYVRRGSRETAEIVP
jgi:hypothetical protein